MKVRCSEDSFYRAWVDFLAPFHKLTKRDREVMARILQQYFRLKNSIPDKELFHDVMWSFNSRKDMRESLQMTPAHFQIAIGKLRKAGVLDANNDLNPRYIPHKTEGSLFILNVIFDWSSESNPVHAQQ